MRSIRVFTPSMQFVAEIDDYSNMSFSRRWHDIDDIELTINIDKRNVEYLQRGNIIIIGLDLHKIFVIKHKEIELDGNWLIKGYGLKSVMGHRITIPPSGLAYDSKQGNAETVMKHYVTQNVISPVDANRVISEVSITNDLLRGPSVSWQSRYKNLAEELTEISLVSGIGWNVSLDSTNNKWSFDVAEGRNLSVNQSTLPPVIFSPQFDSLQTLDYTESELEYRSNAYVGGEGKGELRRIVHVGSNTGLNRHELFVDARDIREKDETGTAIPEAEIIKQLTDRGQRKLDKLIQEKYLEGQILTKSPFKYEVDYDLGDIVTIQNKEWNVTMDSRITEIKEIYEPDGFKIEATFGNNRPTLINKIKQELSQFDREVRK